MCSRATQPRKRVWAVEVKAFNTQYQAPSDGFVKAYEADVSGTLTTGMELLCDAGNPPTIKRDHHRNDDGNAFGGVSWLVAKGEYWRVNWSLTGVVFWRALR